jgi:hypothetical protein
MFILHCVNGLLPLYIVQFTCDKAVKQRFIRTVELGYNVMKGTEYFVLL